MMELRCILYRDHYHRFKNRKHENEARFSVSSLLSHKALMVSNDMNCAFEFIIPCFPLSFILVNQTMDDYEMEYGELLNFKSTPTVRGAFLTTQYRRLVGSYKFLPLELVKRKIDSLWSRYLATHPEVRQRHEQEVTNARRRRRVRRPPQREQISGTNIIFGRRESGPHRNRKRKDSSSESTQVSPWSSGGTESSASRGRDDSDDDYGAEEQHGGEME